MELAPGTILDRYEVLSLLGEGGSAHVHLVRHLALDSRHAMKVVTADDARTVQAVFDEGRIQARVRHPNVVMITDIVTLSAAVGLIMEFVEGRPLSQVIGNGHPLRRGDVGRIFQQVAAGITAAHREGILHRDIKPANVLLDVSGGTVTARIVDFGVARAIGAAQGNDLCVGTPGYMAPEQLEDPTTADARADVFSLGCLLYELCCGYGPFHRDRHTDTLRATVNGHHILLQDRDPSLPAALCAAVERALSVEPERRFATVSQFACACEPGFAQIVDAPSAGTLVTLKGPRLEPHGAAPPVKVRTEPRRMAAMPARVVVLPPPPVRSWPAVITLSVLVVCGGASGAFWARGRALDTAAERALIAMDRPWSAAEGPIARLYAEAEDPAVLRAAVGVLERSVTPEERLGANRQLIEALEREAAHQTLDHRAPGARARGQAATTALEQAETGVEAAQLATTTARLASTGLVGGFGRPFAWLLGAREPKKLGPPDLAAFPEERGVAVRAQNEPKAAAVRSGGRTAR